jgi:peptidyl-tRNA hydrolase
MKPNYVYKVYFDVDKKVMDDYVNGIFTKTICEARNKTHLLKAKNIAKELGLIEGEQFGEINDRCLTELQPENEDGTTLVGIWFAPLDDDIAHKISKKYQLYRG